MRQPTRGRRAFSLIELIVVIGIIVIVGAMTYPILAGLTRGSRAEAGLNSVNTALAAARTLATQAKASLDPPIAGARFSGAAVIFTPAGEMRLVESKQDAQDGASPPKYLAESGKHGFADVPNRPYIVLPTGSAVIGITRNDVSTKPPLLLAPPFAIRFNEYGTLLAGQSDEYRVYYDGFDYNTEYTGLSRANNYLADNWDPLINTVAKDPVGGTGRYCLPFERLETVVGVIVYDRNEFYSKGFTLLASISPGGGIDTSSGKAGEWLLKNGKILMVDRYSGSLLRH